MSKKRRTDNEVRQLKERMFAARANLPRGSVQLFVDNYPEYDTYKLGTRVSRVWSSQLVDEDIIEKFEELASKQSNT